MVEENNKINIEIVYKFINTNCEKGKIKSFVFLEKELENTITYEKNEKIILLGLCKKKNDNNYNIKSVIYNDYIFEYDNPANKIFIEKFEIDVKKYDLLIWIQFESFKIRGSAYKNN